MIWTICDWNYKTKGEHTLKDEMEPGHLIFSNSFSFATSQKSLKTQWWKRQHKFNSVRLDKLICFDPGQWTCYTPDNGRQRTSSDMKSLLWPSPITPSLVSNSGLTQKCALLNVMNLNGDYNIFEWWIYVLLISESDANAMLFQLDSLWPCTSFC